MSAGMQVIVFSANIAMKYLRPSCRIFSCRPDAALPLEGPPLDGFETDRPDAAELPDELAPVP
jgi:hypothetical protein